MLRSSTSYPIGIRRSSEKGVDFGRDPEAEHALNLIVRERPVPISLDRERLHDVTRDVSPTFLERARYVVR
jgi:hypothetical protein